MRDINQELLSNPFDEELQSDHSAVRHAPASDRRDRRPARAEDEAPEEARAGGGSFFRVPDRSGLPLGGRRGTPGPAAEDEDKLFTFLGHDGVPWNNNNAENAIKRFAYYREDTIGVLTEAGLADYLVLLSICQTCRYKGVSFLKFLLSRERDIDAFCRTKSPSGRRPPSRSTRRDSFRSPTPLGAIPSRSEERTLRPNEADAYASGRGPGPVRRTGCSTSRISSTSFVNRLSRCAARCDRPMDRSARGTELTSVIRARLAQARRCEECRECSACNRRPPGQGSDIPTKV